jgi:hypothetical protein
MEAVSIFETSVNSTRLHGAITQKAVVFVLQLNSLSGFGNYTC